MEGYDEVVRQIEEAKKAGKNEVYITGSWDGGTVIAMALTLGIGNTHRVRFKPVEDGKTMLWISW